MTTAAVTRYVGFCPICEADYKLAPAAWRCKGDEAPALSLVHHGYLRPGTGEIQGDCFAVGALPYELSKNVCEDWRDRMQRQLEAATRALARLRDPELRELSGGVDLLFHGPLTERQAREQGQRYGVRWVNHYEQHVFLKVHRDSSDRFESSLFVSFRAEGIRGAERDKQFAEHEIERMNKYISGWSLKPVRTLEEWIEQDKAKKAAERAAKNAEKQAARDARAAKRRALDERKARWEKERQDLIQMYRDLFTNLAKEPKHAGTEAAAREYWRAMQKAKNKKGYLHFYENELEINDVLIQLGLAKKVQRAAGGYVQHAYSDGYLP